MKCWYVARTQPHKEKLVQINLINQGIATFLPRIKSRSNAARVAPSRDTIVPTRPERGPLVICTLSPTDILTFSIANTPLTQDENKSVMIGWGTGLGSLPPPQSTYDTPSVPPTARQSAGSRVDSKKTKPGKSGHNLFSNTPLRRLVRCGSGIKGCRLQARKVSTAPI